MTSRGARHWNTGSVPLIAPDLLGDIIAAASDIALVVSPQAKVLSVMTNPEHAFHGALGHWEGANLRDHLTEDSRPKLEARLARFAEGDDPGTAVELNHADRAQWQFPVRYTFHRIGADGALLMLGRDLGPIAEMQQQLVRAQLALERDYETQREYDTRFRVLMEAVGEAVIFLNPAGGQIVDANRAAEALLGAGRERLVGRPLSRLFDTPQVVDTLTQACLREPVGHVEATLRGGPDLTLCPVLFRAAGERLIVCRVLPADHAATTGDALADGLGAYWRNGAEAIVFTDAEGVVAAVNESFLNFADLAETGAAKGRSLADFLARGGVDLRVMVETAERNGHMRLYATKLAAQFGTQMPVEISVTRLEDGRHPGFIFVMRDAGRMGTLRQAEPAPHDPVRPVVELVGSSSLKEIVAETTDVVEKMCIEAAVELTRNNRVAAAEMLGLSRQSLYVKLRKYGLLARTAEE